MSLPVYYMGYNKGSDGKMMRRESREKKTLEEIKKRGLN